MGREKLILFDISSRYIKIADSSVARPDALVTDEMSLA
jgi:hypothetical protein